MKRMRALAMVLAGVVVFGGLCERVWGQAEIDALVWDRSMGGRASQAVGQLGYTQQRVVNESGFILMMQSQSWDLVVWDLPFAFIFQPATTLQLLEDHVAGGGRLLVNYNNLDGWPELQRLLGVDGTIERLVPENVLPLVPQHASFAGFGLAAMFTLWADSGDTLIPSVGSTVVGVFPNGDAAIIVSNDTTSIANGFDWDSYGAGSFFVKFQIEYIMACRADFDQSTGREILDIFDFLAFQNAFVHQWPVANMRYDQAFDLFDFLMFQDAFVRGCA